MKQKTSENTEKPAESQPLDEALQVRVRIIMMKRRFPFLDQQYLAKKLKRSEVAVSFALNGKSKKLLARIITHLDYLDRKAA
jgi:hypothetical protein